MALSKTKIFEFYCRPEIQKALVDQAIDRELGVRYGQGFGKRPDLLQMPGDVKEFASKGATSFHISEERWNDIFELEPGMTKKRLDTIRMGWDFILDIDVTDWETSKYISFLLVEALKYHNIKNICVKFSGSKGLHIAVPYESFPNTISGQDKKNAYPNLLRIMAMYLTEFITEALNTWIESKTDERKEEILEALEQGEAELEEDLKFMKNNAPKRPLGVVRSGNRTITMDGTEKKLKGVIKDAIKLSGSHIDTVLISNRHLFRAPYSLHEKSGLVSIPFNPDDILNFEKEMASPDKVVNIVKYIDRSKSEPGEARGLVIQALDWNAKQKKEEDKTVTDKDYDMPTEALPEELFPPCIKKVLEGLEDGKKRALFVLIRFLQQMGWNWPNIEKRIKEWNGKNAEPLRENYILGQISWSKKNKQKVLPPNCASPAYYKDLRICDPEALCSRI